MRIKSKDERLFPDQVTRGAINTSVRNLTIIPMNYHMPEYIGHGTYQPTDLERVREQEVIMWVVCYLHSYDKAHPKRFEIPLCIQQQTHILADESTALAEEQSFPVIFSTESS